MMATRSSLLAAVVGLCLSLVSAAPCQVESPGIERRVLIDGVTLDGWVAVESTLSATVLGDENALLFSVLVDWKSGEAEYPVGWPRIQTSVSQDWGDWRKWDEIRLRVYALTDGDPLPSRPLGITIGSGGRNSSWDRSVQPLVRGKWSEFTFDLVDIPDRDQVHSVGLFISEDAYRDGASVQFYLSDLELLRYVAPTLVRLDDVPTVAFADERAVTFTARTRGPRTADTAPLKLSLRMNEKPVVQTTVQVAPGTNTVSLPLPRELSPGAYTVVAGMGEREFTREIHLVASPWQEAVR